MWFLQSLKGYLHRYYSSLFHTYHSFYGQICMYVAFSAQMCIFTVKLVFIYLVFYFCSHLDYIYIISIDISGMFYQCEQILFFFYRKELFIFDFYLHLYTSVLYAIISCHDSLRWVGMLFSYDLDSFIYLEYNI